MDGSGYIELAELKQALDLCGFKIPQYQVRQMIDEYDRDQSASSKGRLSFDEFESVRLHSSFVYFFFARKRILDLAITAIVLLPSFQHVLN